MSVSLYTRLNRPMIAEGEEATVYLLVQLAAEQNREGVRPPLNIGAVVDRSGSMAGPKLDYTKRALRFLVEQTDQTDRLAIVAFDNEVQLVCPSAPVVNKDLLKAKVDTIWDGGSTNLSGGMVAGYREVKRHRIEGGVNRVLLMTDGHANVGVTSPGALVKKAQELREQGIQLTTLGVGEGFNEDLLTAMAEAGGGNFYFIANPDEIPQLFARELQGLLSTVAQGLEVRFQAATGVQVEGVVGYQPSGSPGQVSVTLPDIYAGEVKALVLELRVEAAFAGTHRLGALTLSYTEATSAAEVTLSQEVSFQVTGESESLSAPEDPEVLKHLYLARSHEAVEQAVNRADQQQFGASGHVLREAAAPMASLAEATGDVELAARAAELRQQAEMVEQQKYDVMMRKTLKMQQHQTRSGRRQDR